MKFFILVQIGFSFGFFVRNLFEIYENKLLKTKLLTKIGTIYLVWMFFGAKFVSTQSIFWTFWVYFPTLVLIIGKIVLKKHRERLFQKHFLFFLNNIILKMNVGNSFRQSFLQSNESNKKALQKKFNQIYEIVVFSQHFDEKLHSNFLKEVIYEFIEADKQPHLARHRLKNFRRKRLIIESFRQKSGHVLRQIRIQSLILTGIYFALLIYVTRSYGFLRHINMILLSASIFIVGLILVFILGKRMKWKI